MARSNFEMETPTATPPPSQVKVGAVQAAVGFALLAVLSCLVAIWQADSALKSLEAKISTRLFDLETQQQDAHSKLKELEDARQLLTRAVQAESRLEAVREELDRVYDSLEACGQFEGKTGKKYTRPSTTTTTTTTTTAAEDPLTYNNCKKAEYTLLCRLSSAGELQKSSRTCASNSMSYIPVALKKDQFISCLEQAVPGLSNNCATCLGDTAAYGVNNCKWACRSPGKSCDECMEGHAEDSKLCMGFMMPGFNVDDDCPKEGLLGV
ncbi:adck1 [Symbiodinium sp. KB8]|nr:adck1 [Symbiodinium sp. KB8]